MYSRYVCKNVLRATYVCMCGPVLVSIVKPVCGPPSKTCQKASNRKREGALDAHILYILYIYIYMIPLLERAQDFKIYFLLHTLYIHWYIYMMTAARSSPSPVLVQSKSMSGVKHQYLPTYLPTYLYTYIGFIKKNGRCEMPRLDR